MENIVVKSLLDVSRQFVGPLTKESGKVFMECLLLEDPVAETQKIKREDWIYNEENPSLQVLLTRLAWPKEVVEISTSLAAFIVFIAKGIPGNLVLWAYTIHKVQQKTGNKVVTLGDLVTYLPYKEKGWPTDEGLTEIWDSQKGFVHKVSEDNLIDLRETWAA